MAIAFGASTGGAGGGGTTMAGPSVSGSKTLGIVVFLGGNGGSNDITAPTWGGSAMTLIGQNRKSGDRWLSVWYIKNPTSGATISTGGPTAWWGCAGYYTGVDQTSPIDSSAQFLSGSTSTVTLGPTTVVGSNCWLVGGWGHDTGSRSFTNGTATIRQLDTANPNSNAGLADSNGVVSTGSQSKTVSDSASEINWGTTFSLLPDTSTTAPSVETDAVSDIDLTTATGNGDVTSDGGATVTERGICWGTSANPTTSGDHATASGTTGAFSASMTGLTEATHYYVRAYAINSIGTSYGDNVEFDTLNPYRAGWTNLPGISFVPGDTETIFAEQLNDILARLHALDGG